MNVAMQVASSSHSHMYLQVGFTRPHVNNPRLQHLVPCYIALSRFLGVFGAIWFILHAFRRGTYCASERGDWGESESVPNNHLRLTLQEEE